MVNSLNGENFKRDFDNLIAKYPDCLKAIPILLAVRENEIYCQDKNGSVNYKFSQKVQSAEQYKYFMRETGLSICFKSISSAIYTIMQRVLKSVWTPMDAKIEAEIRWKIWLNAICEKPTLRITRKCT